MSCIQKREKSLGTWLGALGGGLVFRGSNLCCSNVFGIQVLYPVALFYSRLDGPLIDLIPTRHISLLSDTTTQIMEGKKWRLSSQHCCRIWRGGRRGWRVKKYHFNWSLLCCAWLISRLLTFLKDFLTQTQGKKWKPFNRYIRSWIVIKIPQSIGFPSILFWAERAGGTNSLWDTGNCHF